jgi:hypothetical protein
MVGHLPQLSTIDRFSPRHLVRLLFLLLLLSLPGIAQNKTVKNADGGNQLPTIAGKDESSKSKLGVEQQRAIALLNHLFEASCRLADGELKVRLQARIADTRWRYDQPRARAEFDEALRSIESIKSPAEGPAPYPNLDSALRSELRREIAEAIALHDQVWAGKIALSSIREAGTRTRRLDFDGTLSLAETDPRLAAQLLRENLDVHNPTFLREVLIKIRSKAPALADDLFGHALSLAEKNLSQPFDYFFEVFDYVFPASRGGEIDGSFAHSLVANPMTMELITRFLRLGHRAITQEADEIEQGSDSIGERAAYGYQYVLGMLPSFMPYMPEEAAEMRARWDVVIGNKRGGKKHLKEINLLLYQPSVKSLLARANKVKDPDEKSVYYQLAAYRALVDGDFDQAFSIAGKPADEAERQRLTAKLRLQAVGVALDKGDLKKACHYARDLPASVDRVETLNRLILCLIDKNDNARANEVLMEALRGAEKMDDAVSRAFELVEVAEIATRISPQRGFEIVKSAIEAINRAGLNDGSPFDLDIKDFDKSLLPLARVEFEKALSLAQSLTNANSVVAQVAACRGVLTSPNADR